jgi:uncharacterized membrane protein YfcA
MLIGAAILTAVKRPGTEAPAHDKPRPYARTLAVAVALTLGMYDGFFGPGTGTFLMLAFTALGRSIPHATADAKVVNFASNFAAVCLFTYRGVIVWKVALPMAAAALIGGLVGASLAVKGGSPMIRKVVLCVVIALSLKLALDLIQ